MIELGGLANWHFICRNGVMIDNSLRTKSEILEEAQQKLDWAIEQVSDSQQGVAKQTS